MLILALEEKRGEVAEHFRALQVRGLPIYVHFGRTPLDLLAALPEHIERYHPGLIVIDPVAYAVEIKDYSDYGQVTKALKPYQRLARKSDAHIMLVHHAGKAEREDVLDTILGSTAFSGSVDTIMGMKRKQDGGRSIVSRQRYGTDMPETSVEMNDAGVITGGKNIAGLRMRDEEQAVHDVFASRDEWLTRDEILERVDSGAIVATRKAINRLVAQGDLKRRGEGKKGSPYQYQSHSRTIIATPDGTLHIAPDVA